MHKKIMAITIAACMVVLIGRAPAFAKGTPPGPLTNTATVEYTDADSTPMPAETASITVVILQKQGVSVAISPAALSGFAGAHVVYTVNVTNDGNAADSFTLSSAHNSGASTFAPGTIEFYADPGLAPASLISGPIGPIAADGSLKVYMVLPIPVGTAAGAVSQDDAAAASASDTAVTAASTQVVTSVIVPVTITKTASKNNPTPDEVVTYTITATNTTGSALSGVAVSDDLTNVLGISAIVDPSLKLNGTPLAPQASYLSGNTLTVPVGALASGAAATVEFAVRIKKPASHAEALALSGATAGNVAVVNADGLPTTSSLQADVTVFSPVIGTTKTANPASAKPGDSVTFTITANNTGNDAASNVAFTDDITALPLTYKPGTLKLNGNPLPDPAWAGSQVFPAPGGTSYKITVSVPSLAAGATDTLTFDVTVN